MSCLGILVLLKSAAQEDLSTAKALLDLAVSMRFGTDQIGEEYAEKRVLSSLKTVIPFSNN